MSHSAFLRAVIDSPDDDLPRLVFADYLDETGDGAHAEFIRVQCELATLAEYDPKYRELEDREHELLGANERVWLSDTRGLSEWVWRRGFVDEATECGIAGVESLFGTQPVRSWTFQQWGCRDRIVHRSIELPHPFACVQQLDFSGTERFPEGFTRLLRTRLSSAFNSLILTDCHLAAESALEILRPRSGGVFETLEIGGRVQRQQALTLAMKTDWNHSIYELLKDGPVRQLGIHGRDVDTRFLGALLKLCHAASLRHLDISDNPIGPDAYRAFEQANPAMRLHSLDVSGTPLAGISLESLLNTRALESLMKLEINGCGSARRNMEVLARSKFWTQATQLRTHSGTIPADTLEPLCHSRGPKELRLLDLADNYLRTEGVRMLCGAPWVDPLTWLALSGNYLDDESCGVLAESGRFRNLRTLHLANNNLRQDGGDGEQITDIGACALARSAGLAHLRILSLSHTGISHRGMIATLESPHWRLSGLGVAGCALDVPAAHLLASSPRLARLNWLDLSGNRSLGGYGLQPLAESPNLSPMLELDCGGIGIAPDVRAIFRERLGVRFST